MPDELTVLLRGDAGDRTVVLARLADGRVLVREWGADGDMTRAVERVTDTADVAALLETARRKRWLVVPGPNAVAAWLRQPARDR